MKNGMRRRDNMQADLALINWLLHEYGNTKYSISKATGIHQTTLAKLENGTSLIENLSFKNASALTDYAMYLSMKEMIVREIKDEAFEKALEEYEKALK